MMNAQRSWLLLSWLMIFSMLWGDRALAKYPKRNSRVQQASYSDPGDPFGWQAGDVFDGCGFGGNCGPGCGPSGCAGGSCGPGTVCDDGCLSNLGGEELVFDESCTGSIAGCRRWSAGVEFTLVKPHFDGNPAFTALTSNGTTQDSLTDTEFDFDNALAPRVWIEVLHSDNLGMRVRYWQFEDTAATAVGMPDANGFGRISSPPFADVDLSTSIPGSTFTADSELNAYSIDIEATNSFDFCSWAWMATAGLRFAEVDQSYIANLADENNIAQGSIDFRHRVHGFGPVIGIRAQRPFLYRLALFGVARGSLLFGNGESNLSALEDLDLNETMTTNRTTARDDLLPIGEMQLGLQWIPESCGVVHPYLHVAMESQVWGGAGSASSEDGNLGFYGVNFALGFDW